MKKYIFVALTVLISYATTFAQSKTNNKVETAFKSKFPNATKIKWGKENEHEYEANFTENGVKYSANFSDKGEWLETESPITFDKLPEKVKTAFSVAHKNENVKAIAKIDVSTGETQYEIEVAKGLKTMAYFYNSSGKLVK